ncbi:hypothetical protein [Arthrobacter sp. NPDC090010]
MKIYMNQHRDLTQAAREDLNGTVGLDAELASDHGGFGAGSDSTA